MVMCLSITLQQSHWGSINWRRGNGVPCVPLHFNHCVPLAILAKDACLWILVTSSWRCLVQGKLSEDSTRPTKRERSRGQVLRRQNRLQRPTHDDGPSKQLPAPASSVRFTSFLVADILGIARCSPAPVVTSSDQQTQKSDDFSVERLIHSNEDSATTTCSMSINSQSQPS